MKDPLDGQVMQTRAQAERAARMLGCTGAHRVEGGWMACESPEAFHTLLTQGARVYRRRFQPEEKLLGAAIGTFRRANNSSGRASGAKRKLRRVAYNPDAEDRDADQIVQEGTTAERRVGRAAETVTKKPRRRRVNGPDATTQTSKKPRPKRIRASREPSGRAAAAFDPRPPSWIMDLWRSERPNQQARLDEADAKLKKLGHLGRYRSAVDGPLPEADMQRRLINRRVEKKFGKLVTVEDHERALKQAFPNARINLFSRLRDATEDKWDSAGESRFRPETFGDEESLAMGLSPAGVESLKAYARGFLYKSLDDPETAKLIGSIDIDQGAHAAAAGLDGTLPTSAPLGLWVNPMSTAQVYLNSRSDKDALFGSQRMLDQLAKRKKRKNEADMSLSLGPAFADGDIELGTYGTAFHEWGHLVGARMAWERVSAEHLDSVQAWVKDARPAHLSDLPSTLTRQLVDGEYAAREGVSNIQAIAAKEGRIQEADEFFEQLGFVGLDWSDSGQVAQLYRALAARRALGMAAGREWRADTNRRLTDTAWNSIDTVSGYSNRNKEEALAEIVKLVDILPDYASHQYGDALKKRVIAERIT